MTTKAELELQVEMLTTELAHAQGVIGGHVTTIEAMTEAIAVKDTRLAELEIRYAEETSDEINAVLSRRCINCGNTGRISYDGEAEQFRCAACNHSWTMTEEQSPHRR